MKPTYKKLVADWVRSHMDYPNRTSARLMMEANPGVFTNLDAARVAIIKVRGGDNKGSTAKVKGLERTKAQIDSWRTFVPRPEPPTFEVYKTPTMLDLRYLVLADIHGLYFDRLAFECAVQSGIDSKCNAIILLGDIADCYQLSSFVRDPRKRNMQYEIDFVRKLFNTLQAAINPVKFIWKLGNHEERIQKYLMNRAPELIALKVMTTRSLFEIAEGIDVVNPNNPIKHKALTLLHGHEYRGGFVPPVNPARGMFLKANGCVVSAHRHVSSEHTETTIDGKVITCWSLGCLCDLHPEYAPLNKWNHGFGILETSAKGEFWKFHNKRIVKGVVV